MNEYNINEALVLLKEYILIAKNGNLYFCLNQNEVIIFNANLTVKYSINEFIKEFKDMYFYIYKSITEDNIEINFEEKKYRQ